MNLMKYKHSAEILTMSIVLFLRGNNLEEATVTVPLKGNEGWGEKIDITCKGENLWIVHYNKNVIEIFTNIDKMANFIWKTRKAINNSADIDLPKENYSLRDIIRFAMRYVEQMEMNSPII